jgi:hypothetical protein
MTITNEIRTYLNRSHAYAWSKTPDPGEPDLVHAFLADEMWPRLQEIMRRRVVSGTDVVLQGIFTHQTPYVKEIGQTNGCELADLMLVKIHKPVKASPVGKALLVQLKKNELPKTGSLTAKGDSEQFRLYSAWNLFNGTSRLPQCPPSPALPMSAWNFRGNGSNSKWTSSAQYGVIFKGNAFAIDPISDNVVDGPDKHLLQHWPNHSAWASGALTPAGTANQGVNCCVDFAETLQAFAEGKVGRDFDPEEPIQSDHWSIFVREMLLIATLENYRYRKTLPRSQTMHIDAFSTVLPIVAKQQVIDMLGGYTAATRFEFEFINNGLMHLNSRNISQPPQCEERNESGHIPILLMVTYGEDLQFKD